MKTQTIEIDDDTATELKQRAEGRGVSVPKLVAELVTLEAGPAEVERDEIAELDRRWKAFEAQDSAVSNDEVVRWLQTWALQRSGIGAINEAGMVGRGSRRP